MQISAAGGKATITLLDDALIRLTWSSGSQVSAADARDVLEQSLNLVNNKPYAILVDMHPIISMSSEARELYGAETKVLAAAMLGRTPMDRVLAASVAQSVHEVRFFENENAALDWLSSSLPQTASELPRHQQPAHRRQTPKEHAKDVHRGY